MDIRDKVVNYLNKNLPDSEERIAVPISPHCEVCVVIPAYGERDYILRPMETLAAQKGINIDQYEVIIVVNNPGKEPIKSETESDDIYRCKLKHLSGAIEENQYILNLIRYINNEDVDIKFREAEKEIIEMIKKSGVKIFAVDKASPGKTLPPAEANVGGARNRGLAEAVARFYDLGRNGIIAHTDADTLVDEYYVRNLLKAFKEKPEIIGLCGIDEDDLVDPRDVRGMDAYLRVMIAFHYDHLFWIIANESPGEKSTFINFCGSNMASRAFEAAVIGGIPKTNGSEDTRFGKSLGKIGKIGIGGDIRTASAIRSSARANYGTGCEMIEYMKEIEKKGLVELRNPEQALYLKQIHQKINEASKNQRLTPGTLKQILCISNRPLLNDDDLLLFNQKILQRQGAAGIEFDRDPGIKLFLNKIYSEIDRTIGRMELKEACSSLIDIFCCEPIYKEGYMALKDRAIETIRLFEKILEYVLNDIFEHKPQHIDSDILLNILELNLKKMGFNEDLVTGLSEERFLLTKLSRLIEKAKTKEEARELIKNAFVPTKRYRPLILPEKHSIAFKLIELNCMRNVVFDDIFDEHS